LGPAPAGPPPERTARRLLHLVAAWPSRLLAAMVTATLAGLLIPLLAGPASAHEEKEDALDK
jgi:hypothetical protein